MVLPQQHIGLSTSQLLRSMIKSISYRSIDTEKNVWVKNDRPTVSRSNLAHKYKDSLLTYALFTFDIRQRQYAWEHGYYMPQIVTSYTSNVAIFAGGRCSFYEISLNNYSLMCGVWWEQR